MTTEVFNIDCIEGMRQYPDRHFQLAIADPPYGIGMDKGCNKGTVGKYGSVHKAKNWDCEVPRLEYWEELFRVSAWAVIWGGNYFTDYLPPSKSWIIWDKVQPAPNFSACEMAWTNVGHRVSLFRYAFNTETNKIHPTQKPVQLYKWLLTNYAKEGDKILDTHLGSGSSRIAADHLGFDFTGFEIDKEYFDASIKRFNEQTAQIKMAI